MTTNIFVTEHSPDYELLDSGEGEKLERFGRYVIARPDPQALWVKRLPRAVWSRAGAVFSVPGGSRSDWRRSSNFPQEWEVSIEGATFVLKLASSKHVGLFPEQSVNWQWLKERVKEAARPLVILNLFGYTGGATLAALALGASVVHVDASRAALAQARENARRSDLTDRPARWINEDAPSFVKREIRRGSRYDGLIMDPPAFGRGARGEVWKIEKNFLPLLDLSLRLLVSQPALILINGYAAGYSHLAYHNGLRDFATRRGGFLESGELAIKESGEEGRLLPAGVCARWRLT